jgi:hypothetical protein
VTCICTRRYSRNEAYFDLAAHFRAERSKQGRHWLVQAEFWRQSGRDNMLLSLGIFLGNISWSMQMEITACRARQVVYIPAHSGYTARHIQCAWIIWDTAMCGSSLSGHVTGRLRFRALLGRFTKGSRSMVSVIVLLPMNHSVEQLLSFGIRLRGVVGALARLSKSHYPLTTKVGVILQNGLFVH